MLPRVSLNLYLLMFHLHLTPNSTAQLRHALFLPNIIQITYNNFQNSNPHQRAGICPFGCSLALVKWPALIKNISLLFSFMVNVHNCDFPFIFLMVLITPFWSLAPSPTYGLVCSLASGCNAPSLTPACPPVQAHKHHQAAWFSQALQLGLEQSDILR